MRNNSKKRPKQNSFLRFFAVLSKMAKSLPRRIKRNGIVICAAVVALGIVLSAITSPQPGSSKSDDKKQQASTAATQPATTVPVGHRIDGIPVIDQDYFRAGCETYACTMLLQGLGFDIDEYRFVDEFLIMADFSYDEEGNMYGPDMNSAFAGDIFTGAGIYCPAMAKSMNKFLETQKTTKRAYPIKGKTLAQLCEEYIDKDIPVMTWVTTYMEESYERFVWIVDYVDENAEYKPGESIAWRQNEHCMVLIGYTDREYIFCDSVAGKIVSHDKALCETRFKEIGNQAIVVKDP